MELSFNELERRLLRFLKEEFLEKGSKPMNMLAPATRHLDVMEKFGLNLRQYSEIMARLEYHGIVQVLAIKATYGHLRISPVVLEIVRQLDEQAEQAKAKQVQTNPVEHAKQCLLPIATLPPPRLTIDLARMGATLDGAFMDCKSRQALRLLKVYAEHPGEWISSTELKKYDGELDGAKPHVLKKLLPPTIRSLIQSDRRKGSRLNLS